MYKYRLYKDWQYLISRSHCSSWHSDKKREKKKNIKLAGSEKDKNGGSVQNELTMLGQKLDNQQIDLKLMHCFVTSRLAGPFSCPNMCYRGKRQIEERKNGLGRNVMVLYRGESSSDVKKSWFCGWLYHLDMSHRIHRYPNWYYSLLYIHPLNASWFCCRLKNRRQRKVILKGIKWRCAKLLGNGSKYLCHCRLLFYSHVDDGCVVRKLFMVK